MSPKTIAIMTGGGDAPGLNAAIRAVVKRGGSGLGWRVLGIEDSLDGLLQTPRRVRELDRDSVRGILRLGGTILGTTNRGNPFTYGPPKAAGRDRSGDVAAALREYGCEGLIAIGGDGTMGISYRLMRERGIPIIGIPKTIDNDVPGTEVSFGFDTAMAFATEAVDRLHSTAEAHDRVMVLEVMGRNAGHIALWSGVGGGADIILIPEIPFRWDPVIAEIERRRSERRFFSIVIAAEGATLSGGDQVRRTTPGGSASNLGGIGQQVAEGIAARTDLEVRCAVLGHLQRGGTPTPYDRVLASRMGNHAVDLVAAGQWGHMVAVIQGRIASVPLEEVAGQPCRVVDVHGDLVRTARGAGIVFGDEDA